MDRLIGLIEKFNNRTVVGLDTRITYIPQFILKEAISKFQDEEEAVSYAIIRFNKEIIDAIKDIVPAIKLQMACYEAFGVGGIKALKETALYAKQNGMYVIFDGKRNDIGSSMEFYSKAYLSKTTLFNKSYSPFCCDSLTVNLYLGSDTLKAVLEDCIEFNKTIFVLLKTSNPSSSEIQNIKDETGEEIFLKVAKICETFGEKTKGKYGYQKIGAVVGATQKEELKILRKKLKNTFFLVPGYGAQGANALDVSYAFEDGKGAIINNSRQILCAWQQKNYDEKDFAKAAREAAVVMRDEINKYI